MDDSSPDCIVFAWGLDEQKTQNRSKKIERSFWILGVLVWFLETKTPNLTSRLKSKQDALFGIPGHRRRRSLDRPKGTLERIKGRDFFFLRKR